MSEDGFNIAVVGATGAVGNEMIKTLESRNFPVKTLKLLASAKSVDITLDFKRREYDVEELDEDSFEGVNIALFSAGGAISKKFAPIAVEAGAVVIDNSSAWRMDPEVPLVVPEVNPQEAAKHKGIIANPNCSTIQMVVALNPLHQKVKIKRVVVSTYQSVSGSGQKAIDELSQQMRDIFSMKDAKANVYPHRIAFNCIPHIDVFQDDGYTKEEIKMANETKKIMGDDSIEVNATCVRVPVFYSHSESVNIEFVDAMSAEYARDILAIAPGVAVLDDPSENAYPMAINAAGNDDVFVGRIRKDPTVENGLNLWVVSDNIRKGAALNAVQIAELLITKPN
jgi:aspartate-semialdehyde dehydrogenase